MGTQVHTSRAPSHWPFPRPVCGEPCCPSPPCADEKTEEKGQFKNPAQSQSEYTGAFFKTLAHKKHSIKMQLLWQLS